MNAVGIHIRKLRKQHSLSQQALAEQLNVTRQAVSQWEVRNTQPDLDTLERIADVFGVDIIEVIYGEKQAATSRLTPQQRKWYWVGFVGFGILVLALWAILKSLQPKVMFGAIGSGWMYIFQYGLPVLYLLIPMSVLSGCSLVWDIRIQRWGIRIIVFFITLSLILFYYIFSLILELSDGINVWDPIWYSYIFLIKNTAFFILPGIGLFLGLNGHRADPKRVDTTMRD